MGEKTKDVPPSLRFTGEPLLKYCAIKKAFEDHFIVKRNTIYDRRKFHSRTQEQNEAVGNFIADRPSLAKYRYFGELHDDIIWDLIVVGVQERELSEKMP